MGEEGEAPRGDPRRYVPAILAFTGAALFGVATLAVMAGNGRLNLLLLALSVGLCALGVKLLTPREPIAARVWARVELFPTDSGGRMNPIHRGDRAWVRLAGQSQDVPVELNLDDSRIAPGGSGTGVVLFRGTGPVAGVAPAATFAVREAGRDIGAGEFIADPVRGGD